MKSFDFDADADVSYPETATAAQKHQYHNIEFAVCYGVLKELSKAYFGTMVDTGGHLTPIQLSGLAGGVAQSAVLKAFAAGDARDATG